MFPSKIWQYMVFFHNRCMHKYKILTVQAILNVTGFWRSFCHTTIFKCRLNLHWNWYFNGILYLISISKGIHTHWHVGHNHKHRMRIQTSVVAEQCKTLCFQISSRIFILVSKFQWLSLFTFYTSWYLVMLSKQGT